MHRLIVTQRDVPPIVPPPIEKAKDVDPDNHLLARQNRRRLDGEAIRDALLAASGQLNPALGGPGVFPPLAARAHEALEQGGHLARLAAGRGPQSPQPLRLHPAQPPLPVLRVVRPPRYQCELPPPTGDHDRPPGPQPSEQPPLVRRPRPPSPPAPNARPAGTCRSRRACLPSHPRPPSRRRRAEARPRLPGFRRLFRRLLPGALEPQRVRVCRLIASWKWAIPAFSRYAGRRWPKAG